MKCAREGYPFIIICLVSALLAWLATFVLGLWMYIIAVLLSVLTILVAWFFRDPERDRPVDQDIVVAPADGKIIAINEIHEPSFFDGPCRRITIFLSIFNVHIQRAPIEGKVIHKFYKNGEYLAAWNEKASEKNEQSSLGIATQHGSVMVRQIAGLIARRIVTYPELDAILEPGERIGLIRFGSRVDLFIPTHWKIECKVGDKSLGGVTVLAKPLPLSS
ncbi:MAG: phosphatidylserine decarboxylase family protein [Longimicrobiales bacterium]